jgi:hypothetical protein
VLVHGRLDKAAFESLAADPATGTITGRVYYHTGDGEVRVYNGSSFKALLFDDFSNVSGTLPIASGGTGQTSANAALNALLPDQTGNTGKALVTDGTGTAWEEMVTGSELTTHEADTSTHGVGTVVGTSEAQTLTNKTIVAASNTITTASAGNLAATTLNAALAELQEDFDTHVADTTTHGTTGAIVGTSDAQTLTNKTISGAANTITNVSLTTAVTGTLPVANGGTGETTLADLLVALLPDQATHASEALITDGAGVLSWQPVATDGLAEEHIKIGDATNTASAVDTAALGDILATEAGGLTIKAGAVDDAHLSGGISYGKLNLTGAILNADLAGSIAYSKLALTGEIATGDLKADLLVPVGKGGTGVTSLAAGAIPYGAGTAAHTPLAIGTAGKSLVSDGSAPGWQWDQSASSKSANYTITDSDGHKLILATSGASNITITLPAAANNSRRTIQIKKVDSGAGGVVIDGNGSETIDGSTTLTLYKQYESVTLRSDGSNWHILAVQWATGTYTPTVTSTNNAGTPVAKVTRYTRLSATTVMISGMFDATPAANGTTSVAISLPIASNFSTPEHASGSASIEYGATTGLLNFCYTDSTNDRVYVQWSTSGGSVSHKVFFTFTYTIV